MFIKDKIYFEFIAYLVYKIIFIIAVLYIVLYLCTIYIKNKVIRYIIICIIFLGTGSLVCKNCILDIINITKGNYIIEVSKKVDIVKVTNRKGGYSYKGDIILENGDILKLNGEYIAILNKYKRQNVRITYLPKTKIILKMEL